ncbi:hypothetical protein GOP47_0009593 [Adiantum capillus-veneris]|uniref:ER membrane protein complex subunit 2 n=1 Tax=Adiantum capillus-veneris TaxID=13818 RepID=A0A9D4ZIV3_ADICA|nr:hypothetical protein GOP47_0009593 [Adiantum capillus-veneris]
MLETTVDEGVGDVVEWLALLRKFKLRRSDKVTIHGCALLSDPSSRKKLGSEVWTVYEQVAIASMDCQCLDISNLCIERLLSKFSNSVRVGRLEGMLYEAKGQWQQAEKKYQNLLELQPADAFIHKRKVAIAKGQGNLSSAVEALKQYLDIFMADHEAWRELAEIYISLQKYNQAAFCYEELIMMDTSNANWHLNYAEVYYTIGGVESLRIAKKYYASAIKLSAGKNLRALYGICLCSAAINQAKGRNKDEESIDLQSLASSVILKEYKEKCPKKLALVTSVLEKQKP